jgi:hypothetical protein
VERVEEDSGHEFLVCAQEATEKDKSDSDSAVSKRMRIKAPEVVQKVPLS